MKMDTMDTTMTPEKMKNMTTPKGKKTGKKVPKNDISGIKDTQHKNAPVSY